MTSEPTVSVTFSDEDDEMEASAARCQHEGSLSKWTNYIHGWQSRWMVLVGGTLSYYKSERERGVGCRGAISIHSAKIKPHEFDECRLDVCVNDSVWYLRSSSLEERNRWIDAIEKGKLLAGGGSIQRHGSSVSLSSTTLSASTNGSRWLKGLREKLAELETYRDLMTGQMNQLQRYFDQCLANTQPANSVKQRLTGGRRDSAPAPLTSGECSVVDFKGEAITFKATSVGVLDTLRHCIELMSQREDVWRRRVEREQDRCRQLEDALLGVRRASPAMLTPVDRLLGSSASPASSRLALFGGPDYQEGPHSAIGEDEFFDAVETALDRIQDDQELTDTLRRQQSQPTPVSDGQLQRRARLLAEVRLVTDEQLHYALAGVDNGVWTLFAEEGEMKMYKREEEIDGLAVDPLKAVHVVSGVTAHEVCWHFWSADVRLEWETTVERVTVLEMPDDSTAINLQLHNRIWPSTQRDSLFWSHLERQLVDGRVWSVVVNHSTEHDSEAARRAAADRNVIRLRLTVCMACTTEVVAEDGSLKAVGPGDSLQGVGRDRLRSRITYCAVINPGGWAPTSALRMFYKREYPRFLKRFTEYVIERCKNKPIEL